MATEKQFSANRANAQLSTGPVTPEGKAACSHNAVKTGLTGRTVLLPTDDVAAYQQLIVSFHQQWLPTGDEESRLVQSLADTEWRLDRIPASEAAILAVGRYELAGLFPEVTDAAARTALIEGRVLLTYRRDLSNLALQETRLCRRREKETADLKTLQTARKSSYEARLAKAAGYLLTCLHTKTLFEVKDIQDFGSEFSLEDLLKRAALARAKKDRHDYEVVYHRFLADLKKE